MVKTRAIRKTLSAFLSFFLFFSFFHITPSQSAVDENVKLGIIGRVSTFPQAEKNTLQDLPRAYPLNLGMNGKTITDFSSRGNSACAIAGGNLYCWGYGVPYSYGSSSNPREIQKPLLYEEKDFSKVDTGTSNTKCAIVDSKAFCWGVGSTGQIGNGSTNSVERPTAVSTLGVLANKKVTDISVGSSHACAIADGQAFCWGANYSGQLGDGTTTNSSAPVAVQTSGVLSGKTITRISASDDSTCAIANNQVFCWGDNSYGQLGNTSPTRSSAPIAVVTTGALAGKVVTEISVTRLHACAVASGSVICWGYNGNGQFGNGSISYGANAPTAVNTTGVLAGKSLVSVDVESSTSCAATTSEIFCWGYNYAGQLGNGSTTDSNIPVKVSDIGTSITGVVKEVYTGSTTCAHVGAKIYCWGNNGSGQFGDGTTVSKLRPTEVLTSSPASSATKVSAIIAPTTSDSTFTFVADNRSYSHSLTLDSQLTPLTLPIENSLGSLTGKVISTIARGFDFTCYLVESRVYCAGSNAFGQLGNGTQATSTSPVEIDISGVLKGKTITDLAAGNQHACVIASAKVYCWGSNSSGQLGASDTRDGLGGFKTVASLSPTAVNTTGALKSDANVQSLFTTQNSTCVVADGSPYCWGAEVLGFHAANISSYGVPLALVNSGDLAGKKVVKIEASAPYAWGTKTVCALSTERKVYCWSSNANYRGSSNTTTFPGLINSANFGARPISDVKVSDSHACILSLGQMYCWGLNDSGQLGQGDTVTQSIPVRVKDDGLLKNQEVVNISLIRGRTYFTYKTLTTATASERKKFDDAEALALSEAIAAAKRELDLATTQAKSDALAAEKERDKYGSLDISAAKKTRNVSFAMLGVTNAKVDGALSPYSLDPSPLFGGRTPTLVETGGTFACAIAGGLLYCWGDNEYGQLGDGTNNSSAVPVRVRFPEKLNNARLSNLSLGQSSACVLADTNLMCWGNNRFGQLGNGTETNSSMPIAVDTSGVLKNLTVTDISVGINHVCAIANSRAFCWGNNQTSNLGVLQAKLANSSTPVAVETDGVLKGKTLVGIAVGANHSCGFSNTEVFCWGSNYSYELGNGDLSKNAYPIAVSGLPKDLKQIQELSLSTSGTCALIDKNIYCWGSNEGGRFAKDLNSNYSVNIPTVIDMKGALLGREFQSISLSVNSSCALASGATFCWGNNSAGLLGTGDLITSVTPKPLQSKEVIAGAVYSLSASRFRSYACAIASGKVYCWGDNYYSQGGRAGNKISNIPVAVGSGLGDQDFQEFSDLSYNQNYANYSFLGDSIPYILNPQVTQELTPISFPSAVGNLGTLQDKKISDRAERGNNECFISLGTVYCKGQNNLGQLGNGTNTHSDIPVAVDLTGVLKGLTAQKIVMGYSHVCALADSRVFCWGDNSQGQLGISEDRDSFNAYKTKSSTTPVSVSLTGVLQGKTVTDIAASSYSTCVIASGELYCWGQTTYAFGDKNTKVATSGIPLGLTNIGALEGKKITDVFMGNQNYLICVIASNRGYCISNGSIPSGSQTPSANVPVIVGDKSLQARPISSFSIGSNHACLISMGEVFCWGANSSGQLGTGDTKVRQIPTLVTSQSVLEGREVFAIAAGSTNTLFAHRAVSSSQAREWDQLKRSIASSIAEEERIAKAKADAEAKAKLEAERIAKEKADAAAKAALEAQRSKEIALYYESLQGRRAGLIQTIEQLSSECIFTARSFNANQKLTLSRTSIKIGCDNFDVLAKSLGNKKDDYEIKDLSDIEYKKLLTQIQSENDQIRVQIMDVQQYFEEISNLAQDFDTIIELELRYENSAIKFYRSWLDLETRLSKLPAKFRSTITSKPQYLSAKESATVVTQSRENFASYRTNLKSATSGALASGLSDDLAEIISALENVEDFDLEIKAVTKLIPAFICVKGTSATALPKSGKCPVGSKKISTN
ncbi:MAG: hypothetical protein FJW47_02135 [Actinobacteria bacterium]|nr:hypothetical protein [Actinomycetota bacterium]